MRQRPLWEGRTRMRILVWFTIGFTIACAVGVYLLTGMFLLLLALFSLCAVVALFSLKSRLCRICATILLGFFVGCGWLFGYDTLYLQTAREYDSLRVETTITVSDYSYDTENGVAADAELDLNGKGYHVRVYLPDGDALIPGDVIKGSFRLRLTTKDGEKGETYHQGKGILLLAYGDEDATVYREDSIPVKYFAAQLRRQITDILDTVFPEDTLAFARALLLGDSSRLTYEEDTAFKLSGIRHIIAVSGLHISILFSVICFLSGKRRISTALIGIPILILFAAIAGFTPSVNRACIMQGLVIVGLLLNREYDPPTALAFSVLVMLVTNPLTITSVSFQLSVGCLLGIFAFYQQIYQYFLGKLGKPKGKTLRSRFIRWGCSSVAITTSAMIVTTPLSAAYFGTVSIIGVLTNLLTLWVVSFIFCGIMAACIAGIFWVSGAKMIAWVVSWAMRYVMLVAQTFSGFKLSAVYTCSIYIAAWLVFCYALLFLFWLGRKKHPGVLLGCMALSLVLSVGASWIEPYLSNYRFTVLDVGQGQCLLWQCGGKTYMVDCGGDHGDSVADIATQQLLSQGVDSLEGLILTHYDGDHAGGVEPLLSRLDVKNLYLPDISNSNGIRAALEDKYADRIVLVSENMEIATEKMQISLFPGSNSQERNNNCLSVLFQWDTYDILITGDRDIAGERALLSSVKLPDVELLVVGHHGSKYATGLELLKAARPEAAVICVGEDNSYGHPSEEVLQRLSMFGCGIWRTDLDKTIIFKG